MKQRISTQKEAVEALAEIERKHLVSHGAERILVCMYVCVCLCVHLYCTYVHHVGGATELRGGNHSPSEPLSGDKGEGEGTEGGVGAGHEQVL